MDSSPCSSRPSSSARSDVTFATAITQRRASQDDFHWEIQDIDAIKNGLLHNHKENGGLVTAHVFQTSRANSLDLTPSARRPVQGDQTPSHQNGYLSRADSKNGVSHHEDHENYDFPDEREEEVQMLKQEVQQLRHEREELLENAEKRAGLQTQQAEQALSAALQQSQDEAQRTEAEHASALQDASERLREAESQNEELRAAMEKERLETADLQARCTREQSSREALQEQHSQLQQQFDELTQSLAQGMDKETELASSEKTRELEETHRLAIEHMESLASAQQAEQAALQERHDHLQAQHDMMTTDLTMSRSRVTDLEKQVGTYETSREALLGQVSDHKEQLEKANVDRETHRHDFTELEKACQTAQKERDEYQSLLQETLACTTEMEHKAQTAQRRANKAETSLYTLEDTLGRDLEERNQELAEIRVQILSMQQQLTESENRAAEAEAAWEEAQNAFDMDVLAKDNEILRLQSRLGDIQRQYDERELVAASMSDDVAQNAEAFEALETRLRAEFVVEKDHAVHQAVEKAVDEERESSRERVTGLQADHEEALRQLRRELDRATEDRVAKLETRHENMLGAALNAADDDLEERLREMARSHAEELDQQQEMFNQEYSRVQTQLQEDQKLHEAAIHTNETASQRALDDLQSRFDTAEQARTELTSRHATLEAELSALQARLDAELGAHAEAERALAELRKRQRASLGEKKTEDDTKEALQRRLTVLQAEHDALARRSGSSSPSTVVSREGTLAQLSGDNDSAEDLLQQKAELARQNEFLAKELEGMMSRFGTPQPTKTFSSIAVQTDFPQANGPSQTSSSSLDEARSQRNRSLNTFLDRAHSELSRCGTHEVKSHELLFTQKLREHAGRLLVAREQLAREFQLQSTSLLTKRTQMDRLAGGISAVNFADARRDLFASYGTNVESAVMENFSTPTRQALTNAEGRLVVEHDKKLLLRKSEIALLHLEEMQTLAEEYDRQLGEILGDGGKRKVEGRAGLSSSTLTSKFNSSRTRLSWTTATAISNNNNVNKDSGNNQSYSDWLAENIPQEIISSSSTTAAATAFSPRSSTDNKRSSLKSHLPRRVPSVTTSTPRATAAAGTPVTIPRAMPFPGIRDRGASHKRTRTRTRKYSAAETLLSGSSISSLIFTPEQKQSSRQQDKVDEIPPAAPQSSSTSTPAAAAATSTTATTATPQPPVAVPTNGNNQPPTSLSPQTQTQAQAQDQTQESAIASEQEFGDFSTEPLSASLSLPPAQQRIIHQAIRGASDLRPNASPLSSSQLLQQHQQQHQQEQKTKKMISSSSSSYKRGVTSKARSLRHSSGLIYFQQG